MAPVGNVPAASPATYIEIGTVASETSGASDAPTIEPVAKITAELAPVSACAAASRTTLDRARASPEISSAAAMSIIGQFRPEARPDRGIGRIDSRHYECSRRPDQPTQTGARYAPPFRPISIGQTPGPGCWQAFRQSRSAPDRLSRPAVPEPRH